MSETPTKTKRKINDTDLTPDKMPFKVGKTMEDKEVEEVIKGTDLEYLTTAGKFLLKLLSASDLLLIKTVPKEVVKELLLTGALDKDMNLTNEEGTKTSFKEALLTLKNSEEFNAQPSHTPVITQVEPEKIDPENVTVKTPE